MAADHPGDELPRGPYLAYLEDSKKPVVALIFTLPLFALYHIGVYLLKEYSQSGYKNLADHVLANGMEVIGLSGHFVSFVLVIVVFFFLQTKSESAWSFRATTLFGMVFESFVFAIPPFIIANLLAKVMLAQGGGAGLPWHVNLVLSLGAGVYEEFLFRLILMGLLFLVAQKIFKKTGCGTYIVIMLIQGLAFAAFHHMPGTGSPFDFGDPAFIRVFAFRTLSGVYFGYLYQERGFGIAAGSHAFYDIIAISLNSLGRGY